jgi:hypothetical protein
MPGTMTKEYTESRTGTHQDQVNTELLAFLRA